MFRINIGTSEIKFDLHGTDTLISTNLTMARIYQLINFHNRMYYKVIQLVCHSQVTGYHKLFSSTWNNQQDHSLVNCQILITEGGFTAFFVCLLNTGWYRGRFRLNSTFQFYQLTGVKISISRPKNPGLGYFVPSKLVVF